jgi:hypothetical protein
MKIKVLWGIGRLKGWSDWPYSGSSYVQIVLENWLSRISDSLDQMRHSTEEYITRYRLGTIYLTSINKLIMDGYFNNIVFISLAEQPRSGLGRLIFLGF